MIGKCAIRDVSYRGKTVREHLEYIEARADTAGEQLELVESILAAVKKDGEQALAQARAEFRAMAEAAGVDPEQYPLQARAEADVRIARREIATLIDKIPGRNAPSPVTRRKLRKLLDIDSPEMLSECITALIPPAPSEPRVDQPADRHVFVTLERIVSELTTEAPEPDLLWHASQTLKAGRQDPHRDLITELTRTYSELGEFADELRYQTRDLRDLADAYGEQAGQADRINWTGTETDCKILIEFLMDHGYIQRERVNKFIAKHFVFRGEPKTATQIGKLKPASGGTFVRQPEHLLIPRK